MTTREEYIEALEFALGNKPMPRKHFNRLRDLADKFRQAGWRVITPAELATLIRDNADPE